MEEVHVLSKTIFQVFFSFLKIRNFSLFLLEVLHSLRRIEFTSGFGILLNFHPVDLPCWVSDSKLYYIDPSVQYTDQKKRILNEIGADYIFKNKEGNDFYVENLSVGYGSIFISL